MPQKLTKQIIATTKHQERETIIWDTEVPGLGFRITKTGAKSFILKTRIGGGRSAPVRKPTLGKVGDLTLDQVRTKARKWKALASDGIDPVRSNEKSGRTVTDLCAEYYRCNLHLVGGAGAGRYEEADRLFLDRPYGLCNRRHLYPDGVWYRGRDLSDVEPRRCLRSTVPYRRRSL